MHCFKHHQDRHRHQHAPCSPLYLHRHLLISTMSSFLPTNNSRTTIPGISDSVYVNLYSWCHDHLPSLESSNQWVYASIKALTPGNHSHALSGHAHDTYAAILDRVHGIPINFWEGDGDEDEDPRQTLWHLIIHSTTTYVYVLINHAETNSRWCLAELNNKKFSINIYSTHKVRRYQNSHNKTVGGRLGGRCGTTLPLLRCMSTSTLQPS